MGIFWGDLKHMADLDQGEIKDIVRAIIDELKKPNNPLSIKDAQKKLLVEAKTVENYRKLNKVLAETINADTDLKKDSIKRKQLLQDLDDEYEAQYKILRRNREIQEDIAKTNKNLLDTLYGLGDASVTGAEKISHYTDAFKSFPLFGQAIADIGGSLDFNIDTFRSLASVGADFGQSLVALRIQAREALLPLKEFTDFIGAESQVLAGLYGSTNLGAVGVSNLARTVREQLIPQFAGLGVTTENYLDFLGTFLELQRLQGRREYLDQAQTTQSIRDYTLVLDQVTKLTGIQRDQLNETVRRQGAEAKFAIFLQGLEANRAREIQTLIAGISGMDSALGDAVKNIMATGFPLGEFESKLVAASGTLMQNTRAVEAGTMTNAEFLQGLANSADYFSKSFAPGVLAVDDAMAQVGNSLFALRRNFQNQSDIINSQNRNLDGLTSQIGVTQEGFRQFKSQIEGLQTGFLQSFGPAFAGFLGLTDKTLGGIGAGLEKLGPLTGVAVAGALGGKYLFDYATQVGIVATGTGIANGKFFPFLNKQLGAQGSMIRKLAGGAGRLGLGGLGAAGVFGAGELAEASESFAGRAIGVAGSAASGAMLGSVIPGVGTTIGAIVGGLYGLARAIDIPERAYGGPIDPRQPTLVGEMGPELITTATKGTVLPNSAVSSAISASDARLQQIVMDQGASFKQFAELSARMEKHLNTLVSISAKTETNTGNATRRLANLGNLV